MNVSWSALGALIRKDLILYFSNRRALLITVAAPIAIAAFFGSLFGTAKDTPRSKVPIAIVDLDRSATSQRIVAAMTADANLDVQPLDAVQAADAVRRGKLRALLTLPAGFGGSAPKALLGRPERPAIDVLYDPSQGIALQMVQGLLAQHVMVGVMQGALAGGPGADPITTDARRNVLGSPGLPDAGKQDLIALFDALEKVRAAPTGAPSDAVTGGAGTASSAPGRAPTTRPVDGAAPTAPATPATPATTDTPATPTAPAAPADASARAAFHIPYTVHETQAKSSDAVYNSYSHAFAGMGVQFILFMGVDLGIKLLTMRRLGLWQRLRAAPLSRAFLLASQVASGAVIAALLFALIFAAGIVVFGVRVEGSVVGFVALIVAFALMTASFGLFIAALGKTPEATRGLAIFATLVLVMLGGAWVPSFIFPPWLQTASLIMPTRWAVDGFDAMTWRGLGLDAAWSPVLVLLGFALLFGVVAAMRFDWDEK